MHGMLRNNGGLFLLGFGFVVLCMVGVWAVRYRGPALDEVARGGLDAGTDLGSRGGNPNDLPHVGVPFKMPERGIGLIGRDTSPRPGAALDRAVKTAVRVGEAEPRGLVDPEHVRVAIAAVEPLWQECFGDQQHRYPPPQRATLRFRLDVRGGAGHFEEPELVHTSVNDPWIRSCLLEALVDAKYKAPPSAEALVITYPFYFAGSAAEGEAR
jgi:hypothetical protein